ncbi:MAG: adenylate/guanylate cyclase domain-containing protein [Acidimicrobiia bacterium]
MTTASTRSVEMVALNADVVGYSRLMADDFERTTSTIEEYRQLVDQKVAENSGTLVNFVGDNFMAVFADPRDAVATAIAITTEIETRNANLPQAQHVRFRMGIDQGEVAQSEDRFFGDALNIAARIQALARPGGMSVSGRVYKALDEPALRFKSIGQQGLKNIPGEVEVFEFSDLPGDGSAAGERKSLSLEAPTVAVLPIHADEVDDQVKSMTSILYADMIHRLSRIPQLKVIEASAQPGERPTHGRARYMIESGIHRAGELLRVYSTLIDVTTMNVVKSHKWTLSVDELLDRSDEMADDMAQSIEVELIIGEPAGLYADLGDPEAIEKIYLGWYHLTTATRESWSRALELFGSVAKSHPEQPYGHVLSAFALWMGAANGFAADPEKALSDAYESAQIGLEQGDPTGMARTVEAAVLMSRGESDKALAAVEKVEIIRPTCDATFGLEGSVRRYLGEWDKAVDLVDIAMRLTGVNKPWYPTVKACSLFMGGRVDQAASVAEMVLEYQPNNLEALLVLAAAQEEMGLHRRAGATAELVGQRFPAVNVEEWIDSNPYQSREMVRRWKEDLVAAGAIASPAP